MATPIDAPSPSIAAIVLAAGKSERMGSPKALLQFGGRTFLEGILDAISRSVIRHTIVVVGRHHAEIQHAFPSMSLTYNPIWEQGMTTSFQAGIRVLPPSARGAVLFLVDHPVVAPETIDALVARLKPGGIVVPVHEGRRGHPVAFSREVLDEILALGPDQGANTVVRRDPARVVHEPVEAPDVLLDVDTPEQYEALRKLKEQQ